MVFSNTRTLPSFAEPLPPCRLSSSSRRQWRRKGLPAPARACGEVVSAAPPRLPPPSSQLRSLSSVRA